MDRVCEVAFNLAPTFNATVERAACCIVSYGVTVEFTFLRSVLDMRVAPLDTVTLVVGGRTAASGRRAPISWITNNIYTGVGIG